MRRFFVILFLIITLCPIATYAQKDSDKSLSPELKFQEMFARANIHLMKGENDKALSCFVNCLKINPSSSACNYQLSRIFLGNKDYYVALNYAKKAHHLKPENCWYSHLLSVIFMTMGDYDNAVKYYELYLKSNPTHEDYENFLEFQLKFHKIDDAIATLNRMETLFGYQTVYSLHRAELYAQKNDINRAAEEYKRIIRTDSTNLSAYGLLEELYYNHGKLAEAEEVQKRISRIDPNNPLSHLSQAMLCRSGGQVDCFYQNLVESFKSDKITVQDKLLIIADIFKDNKIFDEQKVETLFQTLNDYFPESALVHTNFADFYLYVNKPDLALEQLELAVKHNLSDYKNFHTIFQLYFICENYEGLRKFVDDAMDLFPDVAEVYMYSAVAEAGLGHYNVAAESFGTARDMGIEFSPVAKDYDFYFALYNYLSNNKKVAFDYFDKYFNAGSLDWYFTLRYVYCLVDSRENLKRAESLLASLGKEHHKYYFYYFVSAYYKYVKSDFAGAKKDIGVAMTLKPENPDVQALSKKINMN